MDVNQVRQVERVLDSMEAGSSSKITTNRSNFSSPQKKELDFEIFDRTKQNDAWEGT